MTSNSLRAPSRKPIPAPWSSLGCVFEMGVILRADRKMNAGKGRQCHLTRCTPTSRSQPGVIHISAKVRATSAGRVFENLALWSLLGFFFFLLHYKEQHRRKQKIIWLKIWRTSDSGLHSAERKFGDTASRHRGMGKVIVTPNLGLQMGRAPPICSQYLWWGHRTDPCFGRTDFCLHKWWDTSPLGKQVGDCLPVPKWAAFLSSG